MAFVDASVDESVLKGLSQAGQHQNMKYIFDLRLRGTAKDRLGTAQKLKLFRGMEGVYEYLGCRLRLLIIDTVDKVADWKAMKEYGVGDKVGEQLVVTYEPKSGGGVKHERAHHS